MLERAGSPLEGAVDGSKVPVHAGEVALELRFRGGVVGVRGGSWPLVFTVRVAQQERCGVPDRKLMRHQTARKAILPGGVYQRGDTYHTMSTLVDNSRVLEEDHGACQSAERRGDVVRICMVTPASRARADVGWVKPWHTRDDARCARGAVMLSGRFLGEDSIDRAPANIWYPDNHHTMCTVVEAVNSPAALRVNRDPDHPRLERAQFRLKPSKVFLAMGDNYLKLVSL